MELEMMQLKDGSSVPKPTVEAAYMSMQRLCDVNPLALFELTQIARDPGYAPFGDLGQTLVDFNLIDTAGRMHDDTRHVVLSTMAGDGTDMRLVNPVVGR